MNIIFPWQVGKRNIFLKSNQLGLTLLEIMVALGIIAVIVSLAVPNLQPLVQTHRLRSATREIISCLQTAKLEAIKENANAVVKFDIANDKFNAWVDNVVVNWALDAGETIFYQTNIRDEYYGVLIQGTTFTSHTIGFNGRGLPSTSIGGTVTLQNSNGDTRQVVVNVAGNIRVP